MALLTDKERAERVEKWVAKIERGKLRKKVNVAKTYTEPCVAKYLRLVVKNHGGIIIKMHPLTEKGIPDYMVLTSGGLRVFFVETKTTGEICTEVQIEYHKRLKSIGIETYVLDTRVGDFHDIFKLSYKTYTKTKDDESNCNAESVTCDYYSRRI